MSPAGETARQLFLAGGKQEEALRTTGQLGETQHIWLEGRGRARTTILNVFLISSGVLPAGRRSRTQLSCRIVSSAAR